MQEKSISNLPNTFFWRLSWALIVTLIVIAIFYFFEQNVGKIIACIIGIATGVILGNLACKELTNNPKKNDIRNVLLILMAVVLILGSLSWLILLI